MSEIIPKVPEEVIEAVIRKLCENCKGTMKPKCEDCEY